MSNKQKRPIKGECHDCDVVQHFSHLAVPGIVIYKVITDKMTSEGICSGDLISVVPQDHAEAGTLVIAEIDGCTKIRKIQGNLPKNAQPTQNLMEPAVIYGTANFPIKGIIVGRLLLYQNAT